jgi:gliding motility-associated-like protein
MPDPKELVATAVPADALCFGDMGKVTVTATGGTLPYIGTGTFDVVPGTYNYTITDANGCETVVTATVKSPPAITLPVASVTFQPICLQPTGTIVFTSPAEGTGYQYSVDDGITYSDKATFTGLAPGIYNLKVKVTVTDCQTTPAILLTVDPPETLSILPTASVTRQPDCIVTTGTIEVTSPAAGSGYEYSVNGGTTYFATRTFTGLVPGDYSVKIKDIATGCESVEIIRTINPIPPAPAAPTVSVIHPTCLIPSGTITVTAPLGVAYEYSINGTDYQAGTVFANLAPGSYPVTVKEIATGCVSLATARIVNPVPNIPEAPVSSGDLAECAESPVQTLNANTAIVPVTGIRITWFDNASGGTAVASPTLRIIGTRTYYAEASNGTCVSLSRTPVTLTISPIPAVPVARVTVSPTCNNPDGTVVVTSPLGADYVYSIDGGVYQASPSFTDLVWGDHFIRAKNINTGCESAPGEIEVPAVPPAPVLSLVSFKNPICYGDPFTINLSMTNTPDGVYTFRYDGGQFSNVTVSGGTATITGQFNESFKVFNNLRFTANDCNSTGTVNVRIVNPAQLVISNIKVTEHVLKATQKGAIDITVTGGTGTYKYVWSNNATSQDINDISFGEYEVTITDDNNCLATKTIKVPLNNPPVAIDDDYRFSCLALLENLLANDFDPDPIEQNDYITINTVPLVKPLYAQAFRINRDGTFEYLAIPGFNGIDFFVYEISDKHGQTSTARVTITVVSDFDGDGIADGDDPDADGDGILNIYEALPGQDWLTADADGDGSPNYLDIDADGDGIPDNIEAQDWANYIHPSNIDVNNNGVDDAYDKFQFTTEIIPIDTDGDGIPDFLDADSDNDGVPDYIEGHDLDADGKPDRFAFGRDSDGDGLDDAYDTVLNECNALGNAVGSNAPMQDFDGDGIPDWRDTDDDNDGYLTKFEDLNGDGDWSNDDLDYDGHPEYLDYGRDCDLFIPDAFSPNGDNIHDYFQIYCINHFPDAKMYIFDQLGNKLFEKAHYGNLDFWLSYDRAWWNGKPEYGPSKARNEIVPPGTYYYVLDLGNGEVKKSYVFISY